MLQRSTKKTLSRDGPHLLVSFPFLIDWGERAKLFYVLTTTTCAHTLLRAVALGAEDRETLTSRSDEKNSETSKRCDQRRTPSWSPCDRAIRRAHLDKQTNSCQETFPWKFSPSRDKTRPFPLSFNKNKNRKPYHCAKIMLFFSFHLISVCINFVF